MPFTSELPEFTRRIWVSPEARAAWEPRIQRVVRAWREIERLSVVHGLRASALRFEEPEDLPSAAAWAAAHRIVPLPLTRSASGSHPYATTSAPPVDGEPWQYRVVLVKPKAVRRWLDAWSADDHSAMGAVLGYPACCRKFFQKVWVDDGMIDTTWPVAQGASGERTVSVEGHAPENNILLRWLGVRAVSHLPCSFDCQPTRVQGHAMLELGERHGWREEVDWIREALSWPVEWSALHGIAEIKTPVVKVSARTDATAGKYVVRLEGTGYPAEGARGTVFPYRENPGAKLTRSRSFRTLVQLADVRDWRDNGFATEDAQERAHAVLERAASSASTPGSVLDLGCGNGALLARLGTRWAGARLHGIELDQGRAQRGRAHHPDLDIVHDDFLETPDRWVGPFDLTIIMPGRLTELDGSKRDAIRDMILGRARELLVYGYGDWLDRYGDLETLCEAAGIPRPGAVVCEPSAAAAILSTNARPAPGHRAIELTLGKGARGDGR